MKNISRPEFIHILFILLLFALAANIVFAGKLYIKPELERKRAARLLDEADSDFRNAKIHLDFSPEIAITEFENAMRKYKDAVEIIEQYGAGYYTPGDVEDYLQRAKECQAWINKCREQLKKKEK